MSPDLRDARVFVSVVGDAGRPPRKGSAGSAGQAPAIREEIGRRVVLKYLPKFEYVLDKSAAKSARVLHDPGRARPADPVIRTRRWKSSTRR